ncbi:hypothetical protein D3C73_1633280 [compost metagenome]
MIIADHSVMLHYKSDPYPRAVNQHVFINIKLRLMDCMNNSLLRIPAADESKHTGNTVKIPAEIFAGKTRMIQ